MQKILEKKSRPRSFCKTISPRSNTCVTNSPHLHIKHTDKYVAQVGIQIATIWCSINKILFKELTSGLPQNLGNLLRDKVVFCFFFFLIFYLFAPVLVAQVLGRNNVLLQYTEAIK